MEDVWDQVEHCYTESNGTRIHYVTLGEGEPVVFVHGFPDFWYSWRHQMATLAPHFKVIAIDMRAYNLSDKPDGIDNYKMEHLLGDIRAVIRDVEEEKVTLVGHDWGGAISWHFAMRHQEQVERLIIMNLTHPKGYSAVVANPTPQQKANLQYARDFASSSPRGEPVPEWVLARDVQEGNGLVEERYREALSRSYWDGMMNYYRANYVEMLAEVDPDTITDITCPVLQFHGLKDIAVDADGLKDTWSLVTQDYSLVTTPAAGHFVQREAKDLVSLTMKSWLLARPRHSAG
ncbi:MAG: alpha/beta hydrolase [Halioglobus sp.]